MKCYHLSDVPALLCKVPMFKSVGEASLRKLVNAPGNGEEAYEAGDFIVRESEIAECMYILLEGRVDVIIRTDPPVREVSIAKLSSGDFFGEQALLPGNTGRRNAHVKALTPIKTFRVDKRYVHKAIKFKEERVARGDATRVPLPAGVGMSPPDEVRDIVLAHNLFRKHLNKEELKALKNWAKVVSFKANDFIIKQFQIGEYLYLIAEGTAEVFKPGKDGKSTVLAKIGKGDAVGQQSLIPGGTGKCNAYVRATNDLRAVRIPKKYFVSVFKRSREVEDGYSTMPLQSYYKNDQRTTVLRQNQELASLSARGRIQKPKKVQIQSD